jgi:superfamily II DNA or RNA helicase
MRIRFDRGTLVIEQHGTSFDPAQLPEVRWDSRVSGWRAPAYQHGSIVRRLTDAGVRFADETRPSDATRGWKVPELRWYQEAALAAWAAAGCRGVVALPTGAGKTMVAIAAMARLGRSTLVLVPTRVLLDQWTRAIGQCCGTWPGRIGDGEQRIAAVTVSTYASAITWAPRIGDRFALAVVDEVHHVGASCPREVLEMLVAPARLGLTATPEIEAAGVIDDSVGPVVYAQSISDLVGDSLAAFDLVTIPVRLSSIEEAHYRHLRQAFVPVFSAFQKAAPEASWSDFVASAMRSEAGRAALTAWRGSRALLAYPSGKRQVVRDLLARHRNTRTLIFTGNNATAYAIAREFLVMPITHEISRAERAAVMERFCAGEAPVLVSSQVLDEGFDVPEAEIAIVVGGSSSTRQHVQRIGRVLRARTGKRARIYELAVEETTEVNQVERRRMGLGKEPIAAISATATMKMTTTPRGQSPSGSTP